MKIKYVYVISLLVLIHFTVFIQSSYLKSRFKNYTLNPVCPWCEESGARQDVVYLPLDITMVRFFAPADPHFIADMLWLRTVYYFGKHTLSDRQYPYLFHLLDLITDLSPQWKQPYHYASVILPTEAEAVEDGMYILDKGLVIHPDDWLLWFFKGYYLWQNYGDKIGGARALHQASIQPGAPIYLARLSATLATQGGQKELAEYFLLNALKHIKDPKHRHLLYEKLRKVRGAQ
jgi:hypothetical protein